MKLNKTDVGCYADETFGMKHVRDVLAGLVENNCNAPELVAALRADMSDDASEEYEAIDLLNSEVCSENVHFEMCEGNLMLVDASRNCPDCGGTEGSHYSTCAARL